MAASPQNVGHEALSGRALCRLDDIADGEGRGFTLPGKHAEIDVFVVRQGDRAVGYVNSCPHAWTPLDWSPDRFMNMEKTHILCATHGAVFEIESGRCITGPCKGDRLTPFPVTVTGGTVFSRADGA
jgi:nitrite reductase/ring-hydroxylating ferredoxin subunit